MDLSPYGLFIFALVFFMVDAWKVKRSRSILNITLYLCQWWDNAINVATEQFSLKALTFFCEPQISDMLLLGNKFTVFIEIRITKHVRNYQFNVVWFSRHISLLID